MNERKPNTLVDLEIRDEGISPSSPLPQLIRYGKYGVVTLLQRK
jgi:hypothetical protein